LPPSPQPPERNLRPPFETAAAHQLQEENAISQKGLLAGKIVLKP
jgi:hypothetical protein